MAYDTSEYMTISDNIMILRDELSADSNLNSLQGQRRVLAKRRIRLNEAETLTATMLERSQLDLERTHIVAPVSGIVVEEMVEAESFVSKGSPLVTIEDTSAAEVRVSIQMDDVSRIWSDSRRVPGASAYDFPDTPASVVYRIGNRQYRWQGVLERQEGKGLEERTRTLPCRDVPWPPRLPRLPRNPRRPARQRRPGRGVHEQGRRQLEEDHGAPRVG
mgnify:CR=1 FL=1